MKLYEFDRAEPAHCPHVHGGEGHRNARSRPSTCAAAKIGQPEHLKRNPHGQMPTLELDDGHYLSEITAICEYLEEKNPKPAMIGSTPEERAECRMWTRRVDLNICEPLANGYRFGEALKFFEKRIPCAPEASPGLKMIAANRLQWLNGQMARQGHSVRQALHAGRHPAVLLARFRQPGRPAARSRQHQYRRLVRARRRAAFGEGVGSNKLRRHPEERALARVSKDELRFFTRYPSRLAEEARTSG